MVQSGIAIARGYACRGLRRDTGEIRPGIGVSAEGGQRHRPASDGGSMWGQLLLFIPIGVNSRLERAYDALKPEAGGSPLVDIEVAERWTYGLVGTQYCTALRGRVLTQGTS